MIQRIQTIYLLLVAGLSTITLFLPVAAIGTFNWTPFVECGLAAVLSIVALFLFKKRTLQVKICYAVAGLLLVSYLIALVDFWLPNYETNPDLVFKAPIVLPIFAFVLDILAIVAIQKDDKLVRSLDRLR
jgi:hypothetical protein